MSLGNIGALRNDGGIFILPIFRSVGYSRTDFDRSQKMCGVGETKIGKVCRRVGRVWNPYFKKEEK